MAFPLVPAVATAGIGWLYYRRIRRQFGWQPWQPGRATVRMVLLSLVLVLLIVGAVFAPHVALALVGGAVAGAAIGIGNLLLTRLEPRDGVPGYIPHPWIGAALSLLLIARLAWRFGSGALSGQAPQGLQQASPLTMAFAGALIVYYLVYLGGLAWKLRPSRLPDQSIRQ